MLVKSWSELFTVSRVGRRNKVFQNESEEVRFELRSLLNEDKMKITSVVSLVSPVDQSPVNVDSEENSTKPVPIESPLSPDPCSESPLSPEVSRSDGGGGVESASLVPVIPVVRVETVEDSQHGWQSSSNVRFTNPPASPEAEGGMVMGQLSANQDTSEPIVRLDPPASPTQSVGATCSLKPIRVYTDVDDRNNASEPRIEPKVLLPPQMSGTAHESPGKFANAPNRSYPTPNPENSMDYEDSATSSSGLPVFTLDNKGKDETMDTDIGDSEAVPAPRSPSLCELKDMKEPMAPLYHRDIETVLDSEEKKKTAQTTNRKKITCFNCLGEHSVKNCPRPLNHTLIKRRVNQHRSQAGEKEVRYHCVSDFADQFQPGTISYSLREALGLTSRHHFPEYIWQMRKYGYPPGWLEHADEAATSLKIYGVEQGKAVFSDKSELKRLLERMPEYPGFTSPLPENGRDDGEWRGNPFNPEHRRENVAKKFLARKYQKRQYLNACRKQKNDSFTSKPPGDDSGFFNEPVSRPIGTGRGRVLQKAHSSAYVTAPGRGQQSGNWYDGLGQFATDIPSTSGVSSDMREMNRIYENLVGDPDKKNTEAAKRTGGYGNTEEDLWSKRPTLLNYRMTMELERQLEEERETKKLLESPSAQVKPKRSSLRSRSPSLLDPGMTFGDCAPLGVTPAFSCKGNDSDDEIQILEEPKKIDPKENVITLGSDDEDSKLPVLLRNPFYKESTVTVADQSKDNGPKKMKKSNTVSNCKLGEETSTDKRPGQSENVSFITKREKTDQNTILQVLNKVKDKVKPESSPFSELPPMENFAKGMPEMPLQDESSMYTGRLARVLNILQTRKRKRDLDDDSDDDIQIIE